MNEPQAGWHQFEDEIIPTPRGNLVVSVSAPKLRIKMDVTRWERLVEWIATSINRPKERWEQLDPKTGEYVAFWRSNGETLWPL